MELANVILDGADLSFAGLQEVFRALAEGGAVELTSALSTEAHGPVSQSLRVSFERGIEPTAAHLSCGGAFLFLTRPSELGALLSKLAHAGLAPLTSVQLRTPRETIATWHLHQLHHSQHLRPTNEPCLGLCVGDFSPFDTVSKTILTAYQGYGPLAGKRVLVLRAAHQQGTVEKELSKRRAQAIAHPLIGVQALPLSAEDEQTLLCPQDFGLVVFTSVNSVEAYFNLLEAKQLGVDTFGRMPLAAIGESTRKALVGRGANVAFTPSVATGEGFATAIAAHFAAQPSARRKVLLPRALVAREALPNTLREAGVEVRTIALYENSGLARESGAAIAELVRTKAVDIVLLTSGSIAEALADIVQQYNITEGELKELQLASIGPITTEAARSRSLPVTVTAEESSISGLVHYLEKFNSELERA
jgi:uroporphyrinogen-III synthase